MKKICLLTLLMLPLFVLSAQDRIFTYAYQSNVLNPGQREIEIWSTFRTGKQDYYAAFDHRTEFELGLAKNLQTAFYLNLSSYTQTLNLAGTKTLDKAHSVSFSNEWKYKVLDPVANPIGLALYGELGVGTDEYELETKLIMDKKVDKFTIATNLVYEAEIEPEYSVNAFEMEAEAHKAEWYLSAAYALKPRLNLTMESQFLNVFDKTGLAHSALYAGLGISYTGSNFYTNFTVMPQIRSFKGQDVGHTLNLNEFEKNQCRLLFSYVL